MPIEIRELVIKASISESDAEDATDTGLGLRSSDREEIVADCVEQVMEILRTQSER